MGASDGQAGVVADTVAAAAEELADRRAGGEQLGMFELPTRFTGEKAAAQRAKAVSARGPGRPAGAQNRATVEMRDFLRRQGFDPLTWLVRWAQHTPETLALELACDKLEAFDRLVGLYRELTGYFYGKALPVDGAGRAVPQFAVVVGNHISGAPGGRPPWEYLEAEPEENQTLSAEAPAVSHGEKSHGDAK